MSKYSIICSDVDGTLLNINRELSERTIAAIDLLNKRKLPFVMISARMPKAIRPLQKTLANNSLVVAYNGAYIESELKVDGLGVELFSHPIEIEGFLGLLKFISKLDLHFGCYYKDFWFANRLDYWTQREQNNTKNTAEIKEMDWLRMHFESLNHGPHKVMIMGDFEDIDPLESTLRELFGEYIDVYRSKDTYLELNAKAVSKSTSLDVVAKYYNKSTKDIMAFGDNYNDVEMLKKAGFGVAVENARNEAKIVSNEICDSNLNDGVAKTLEKYFHL